VTDFSTEIWNVTGKNGTYGSLTKVVTETEENTAKTMSPKRLTIMTID